jgi:hypothetical protein
LAYFEVKARRSSGVGVALGGGDGDMILGVDVLGGVEITRSGAGKAGLGGSGERAGAQALRSAVPAPRPASLRKSRRDSIRAPVER